MQVVIVGGGIAGTIAAFTIVQNRPDLHPTIITQEPYPLYSACALPHYISDKTSRKCIFLKSNEDYHRAGIRTIFGKKVHIIDTKNKQVFLEDTSMPYDKLIIATGSEVAIPTISGMEKKGVFTFKSIEDADRLRDWRGKNATVIG